MRVHKHLSVLEKDRDRLPWRGILSVLVLALVILGSAAALRSMEFDENYSIFVTGGTARPDWPRTVFTPGEWRAPFLEHTDALTTATLLRQTDVHPPLYFIGLGAWRLLAGDALPALRGLSVLLSLGAVLAWMVAAWRAGLPPLVVGLVLTLAYGFGYTGHIARGFAMAHLFTALAVLAVIEAWRAASAGKGRAYAWAALGGLATGLASFANYLSIFPGAAALAWLVLVAPVGRRRFGLGLAAGLALLPLLGADLYFFVAQANARVGQFEPFALRPALQRLAQFNGASLFGGLPLYVEGVFRAVLGGVLALLLVLVGLAAAAGWRRLGPTRWLWVFGAVAPSLGLLALGFVFNNMPIELRYVAFAAPFCAALIAAAAAAWSERAPRLAAAGLGLLLLVQVAGSLGMIFHPATQQPFRHALAAAAPSMGAETVLLVPFGNDGVGTAASLLQGIPPAQKVLVLRVDDAAAAPARATGFRRAALLGLTGDHDSAVQTQAAAAALRADGRWRSQGVVWRDWRGSFVEIFEASNGTAPAPTADAGSSLAWRGAAGR